MLRILRRDRPEDAAKFAGTYDAQTKQFATSDSELRDLLLKLPERIPLGTHGKTYGPDDKDYEAAVGDYIGLVSGWLFTVGRGEK